MTERWRRYLTDDEREDYTAWSGMLLHLETAARARMVRDDERRRREAEADPLLAENMTQLGGGVLPSPRRWPGETPLADRDAIVDGAGDAPAECLHRYVVAHTGHCDRCGCPVRAPVVLIPSPPRRNPE